MIARDRLPEAENAEAEQWAASAAVPLDWAHVYERYAEPLRRLVARRVPRNGPVDDIVHETFARAIRSTHLIDTTRPPWPFLATVAGRAVADWWQREGAHPWVEQTTMAATEDFPGSDDHARALDRAVTARRALLAMTPRHRRVLYLYEAGDCSYEALTESEQISVQAMKSLLGRARGCFEARYRELLAGDAAFGLVVWLRTASRRLRVRLNPVHAAMGLDGLLAIGGVVVAGLVVGTSSAPEASTSLVASSRVLQGDTLSLPAFERSIESATLRPAGGTRADQVVTPAVTHGQEVRTPPRSPASIATGTVIASDAENSSASFWITSETAISRDGTTVGFETHCDQGEVAARKCQVIRMLPG